MDYEAQIQNSIEYIEDNLCDEIKLSDLAKQCYFSEFYFHKLFSSIVGETIMAYVRKRRLAEAAVELVETKDKITDIALKYNFGSEESFSRAFKKIYGITPRECRNAERKIIYYEKANVIKVDVASPTTVESTMRMSA